MVNDIDARLKNIIIKNAKAEISYEDINENSDFIDDFGFDSISVMQLVISTEKEFSIMFEDDDLSMRTLGTYVRLKDYILGVLSRA